MLRDEKLKLIYRHTHRDFKGKLNGEKSILTLRQGSTTLVTLNGLTDEEIEDSLPYALKKEAEKKTK